MKKPLGAVFHHVGIITADLLQSISFYSEVLGYEPSQVFDDPIQAASIVLLRKADSPVVELICPLSDISPAAGWLRRIRGGPYHTCYRVSDLPGSLERLLEQGLKLTFGPAPAVAFDGALVAFFWGPEVGLIELLEN